jgi:radical SAM superfamily enzyme
VLNTKETLSLFSLEEYTDLLCDLLPLLRPDIVIQRLFGLSDLDMLIAPKWGKKKSEIQHYIDSEIKRRNIVQGSRFS